MAISEDTGNQPVAVHPTGTTATTAAFSPQANTLLVALVAADGGSTASTASVTDSLSGTWTLLKRQNTVSVGSLGGTAEVWCRYLSSAPGSMTVTASGWNANAGDLVVRCLLGASSTQTGATAGTGGTSVAPSATLTPTQIGSWVYGAALDYTTNAVLTANAQSTIIDQFNDATNGDTWGTFKGSASTSALSSTTYGATNANAAYNVAIAEILPAGTTVSSPDPFGQLFLPGDSPLGGLSPWAGAPDSAAAAPSTTVTAGVATVSLAAQGPSTALASTAGLATFTLTGQNASAGLTTLPGLASVSLTGQSAGTGLGAVPGTGTVTLAGQNASPALTLTAGLASFTLTGQSATAALSAFPGLASITTTAQQDVPGPTSLPTAAPLAFAGQNVTVSTLEDPQALPLVLLTPDDVAGGMLPWGGAVDGVITGNATVLAGVATVSLTAQGPSTALTIGTGTGTVSLIGRAPAAGLTVLPGTGAVSLTAQSPSAAFSGTATPGTATVTLTARSASTALASVPSTATVALTARSPVPGISSLPGTATVGLTALDALVTLPQSAHGRTVSGRETVSLASGREGNTMITGQEGDTRPKGKEPVSSRSGSEPDNTISGREG